MLIVVARSWSAEDLHKGSEPSGLICRLSGTSWKALGRETDTKHPNNKTAGKRETSHNIKCSVAAVADGREAAEPQQRRHECNPVGVVLRCCEKRSIWMQES